MKKAWIIIVLIFCGSAQLCAQSIVAGEYFFDADPGVNKGLPIAVTASNSINLQIDIPVSTLGEGFHNLTVRFKDADGKWGLYTQRILYVANVATKSVADLVAAEYFFDSDPGLGKATPASALTGNQVSFDVNISAAGLPDGFHTLAFRVKDADGHWSHYSQRLIYITSNANSVANDIVAGEYLIDADPGISDAIPVALTVSPGVQVSFIADIPATGLAQGFHNLAVRFKNSSGIWGQYAQRLFYITPSSTLITNLIAAEYFIDNDPGMGAGAPIEVSAPVNPIDRQFNVPLPDGLSEGPHFLYVRVKDDLERWSLFAIDTFNIEASLPVTGMKLGVSKTNSGHLLSWHTLTETNSSHFDIEQSLNGVNFQSIGKEQAAGNSIEKRAYSFVNSKVARGMYYYRLKQVDRDGGFVYSNMATIQAGETIQSLQLFPNPASKELQFVAGQLQGPFVITIYNAAGQLQKLLKQSDTRILVHELAAGAYFLSITNGLEVMSGRFMKE